MWWFRTHLPKGLWQHRYIGRYINYLKNLFQFISLHAIIKPGTLKFPQISTLSPPYLSPESKFQKTRLSVKFQYVRESIAFYFIKIKCYLGELFRNKQTYKQT